MAGWCFRGLLSGWSVLKRFIKWLVGVEEVY